MKIRSKKSGNRWSKYYRLLSVGILSIAWSYIPAISTLRHHFSCHTVRLYEIRFNALLSSSFSRLTTLALCQDNGVEFMKSRRVCCQVLKWGRFVFDHLLRRYPGHNGGLMHCFFFHFLLVLSWETLL